MAILHAYSPFFLLSPLAFFVRISGNRFENVSRKTGTSKGKAKKGENENQETIPETHGVEGEGQGLDQEFVKTRSFWRMGGILIHITLHKIN